MLTEFDAALKAKQMKNDVDEYLKVSIKIYVIKVYFEEILYRLFFSPSCEADKTAID